MKKTIAPNPTKTFALTDLKRLSNEALRTVAGGDTHCGTGMEKRIY